MDLSIDRFDEFSQLEPPAGNRNDKGCAFGSLVSDDPGRLVAGHLLLGKAAAGAEIYVRTARCVTCPRVGRLRVQARLAQPPGCRLAGGLPPHGVRTAVAVDCLLADGTVATTWRAFCRHRSAAAPGGRHARRWPAGPAAGPRARAGTGRVAATRRPVPAFRPAPGALRQPLSIIGNNRPLPSQWSAAMTARTLLLLSTLLLVACGGVGSEKNRMEETLYHYAGACAGGCRAGAGLP